MKKIFIALLIALTCNPIIMALPVTLVPQEIKDIKTAEPGFDLYCQLHRRFREQEEKVKGSGKQEFANRLEQALANDYKLIYFYQVLNSKQKLVAILGFGVRKELYWGKYMWIDSLVVDEPYRKQGIAAEIMKYAESYAKNNKLTSVQLSTGLDRIPAQELYNKLMYEKVGFAYRKIFQYD